MPPGVQVLLPGLLDLPLEELDATLIRDGLPCLNYLLGRSITRSSPDISIDAQLSTALFGQQGKPCASLPIAAAFAPDSKSATRCMLLEAIHLQADMQGAIAIPIIKNEENIRDINLIINDLKDYFKADCDIAALPKQGYLLQLRAFDPPVHYPHPLSVLGKSIAPFIEQSRKVLPWYRLVNEFQMFLHQHPVNDRRSQQGRLPINSFWAWGAGEISPRLNSPAWFCDDDLLNGYASSIGLPVAGCGQLRDGKIPEQSLIVDLRLLELLKSGSDASLETLLLDIEGNILEPLLEESPRPLLLSAANGTDFVLDRHARYRFWRKPVNLFDRR